METLTWQVLGKASTQHPPAFPAACAAGGDLLHCLLDGGAFPEHQAGADGGYVVDGKIETQSHTIF
jgi:hypothetical protein